MQPKERWIYYDDVIYPMISSKVPKGVTRDQAIDLGIQAAADLWDCSISDLKFPEYHFIPIKVYEELFKEFTTEANEWNTEKNAKYLFEAYKQEIENELNRLVLPELSHPEYIQDKLNEILESSRNKKYSSENHVEVYSKLCFDKYLIPFLENKLKKYKQTSTKENLTHRQIAIIERYKIDHGCLPEYENQYPKGWTVTIRSKYGQGRLESIYQMKKGGSRNYKAPTARELTEILEHLKICPKAYKKALEDIEVL